MINIPNQKYAEPTNKYSCIKINNVSIKLIYGKNKYGRLYHGPYLVTIRFAMNNKMVRLFILLYKEQKNISLPTLRTVISDALSIKWSELDQYSF